MSSVVGALRMIYNQQVETNRILSAPSLAERNRKDKQNRAFVNSVSNVLSSTVEKSFNLSKAATPYQTQVLLNLSQALASLDTMINLLSEISEKSYESKGPATPAVQKSLININSKNNRTKDDRKLFKSLSESIRDIGASVNKQFVINFGKFMTAFEKLIDPKTVGKINFAKTAITGFGTGLRILGAFMARAKDMFWSITRSIFTLSLLLISPIFSVGFSVLVSSIYALRRAMTTKNKDGLIDIKEMIMATGKLSTSLIKMSIALLILSKVPLNTLLKFSGMMVILWGTLKLFSNTRGGGGGPGGKGPNNVTTGFLSVAAGVSLMALALNAVGEVNWAGAGLMIVFLIALSKSMKMMNGSGLRRGNNGTQFFMVAAGLSLLVLAIDALTEINWAGAGLLFVFLMGLGAAVLVMNKLMGVGTGKSKLGLGGGVKMSGMFGLAAGLAILVLSIDAMSEVSWTDAFKLIFFITAVGLAVALPGLISKGRVGAGGGSGLTSFAFGVGILVLVVAASSEVDWSPAWKLVAFVGGIGLAAALFQKLVDPQQILKGGAAIGASVAAMGLGMYVFNKATKNINFQQTLETFALIGIFAVLLHAVGSQSNQIIKGSITLGVLSGAMALSGLGLSVLNKSTATKGTLLSIAAIGAFAGVAYLIGTQSITILLGAAAMLVLSASMVTVGLGMKVISNSGLNFNDLLMFGGTLLLLGTVSFGIGLIAPVVLLGAAAMVVMSISMMTVGIGMQLISNAKMDWKSVGTFGATITSLGLICAGIALLSVPILLGASTLLVVGAASIVTAASFMAISNIPIDPKQIENFTSSVSTLCWGYAKIWKEALLAVPVSTSIGVVAVATIISAVALFVISNIPQNVGNIVLFKNSVKQLVAAYDQFGVIQAGKAALKATALLPVIFASSMAAITFEKISKLNIDKNAMGSFGALMSSFLTVTTEAISQSGDVLKQVEPNLEAFSKLVSSCSGLVDVVESFANMRIGIWKYDTASGQMKLVGYKPIDDSMMQKVGIGIGKIVQALLGPMSIMSSDDKQWRFGNVVIDNPFVRSNKISQFFLGDKSSGKNRIQQISEAYSGIGSLMSSISNSKFLTDDNAFVHFQNNFGKFMVTLVNGMVPLNNVNETSLKNKSMGLVVFGASLKRFIEDTQSVGNQGQTVDSILKQLMSTLSDNGRWTSINRYLKTATDNVKKLVENVNRLDIGKAAALERNLKLMSEVHTLEGIREVIENLREMIGLLVEEQDKQLDFQQKQLNNMNQMITTLGNSPFLSATMATTPQLGPVKPAANVPQTGKTKTDQKSELQLLQEEYKELQTKMLSTLSSISTKLGQTLQVRVVNSGSVNQL